MPCSLPTRRRPGPASPTCSPPSPSPAGKADIAPLLRPTRTPPAAARSWTRSKSRWDAPPANRWPTSTSGSADIVQLGLGEMPRLQNGRRLWSSAPVRLVALVFGPRVDDPRVREALALAVDRDAIHSVLLQRQGEISGALLPQWLSGLRVSISRPPPISIARARSPAASLASARTLSLAVDDPALRRIADRIALNARDAGLSALRRPLRRPRRRATGGSAHRLLGTGARAGRGRRRAGTARTAAQPIRPRRSTPPSAACSKASA